MRAVPAVGIMKPASMRIVVDLPAPFGPRKPSTSPRATVNVTLSTAVKLPNRLVSPAISISTGWPSAVTLRLPRVVVIPSGGGNSGISGQCKPQGSGWRRLNLAVDSL